MRSGFKMKGMGFGNSPVTKKTGKTLPLDADGNEREIKNVMDSDEAQAYENAVNEYYPRDDSKNKDASFTPSASQIAKELKKIKADKQS
tara:strand:+ start:291 stop:557 length:267 start_codon:yes stop_codon:yes gene_type:complete